MKLDELVLNLANENNVEDQVSYLVEYLGYEQTEEHQKIAKMLLEGNKFINLARFLKDLNSYNLANKTCTRVSLAGRYPSLKMKDGNYHRVEKIMCMYDIFID